MNFTPEQMQDVQARITALKTERDNFIADANRQIAAYNGAIQALEQLIAPSPDAARATNKDE